MNFWIRGRGFAWDAADKTHYDVGLSRRINTRRNRRQRWLNYWKRYNDIEFQGVAKELRSPAFPGNAAMVGHFLAFEAANPGFSRRHLLKWYNAQRGYGEKLRDLNRLVHQLTRVQLYRREAA